MRERHSCRRARRLFPRVLPPQEPISKGKILIGRGEKRSDARRAGSRPPAGEDKGGRQVAPDDFPLHGTEILLKQPRKIKFSQLPAPQL